MSEMTTVPEVAPTPDGLTEPVTADTVNLTGGAQTVQARQVNVQNGSIGALKGEVVTATLTSGGIGAMAANRADVHITDGGIGAMAAKEATINEATSIGVVAALTLSGNPKIMFDLRAGLLAGIVAGAVFGLIDVLARLLPTMKTKK